MMNRPLLFALLFLLVFGAGMGTMYVLWPAAEEELWQEEDAPVAQVHPVSESIETVNMENALMPEGVQDANPPEEKYVDDVEVPSQLSKIKEAGIVGIVSQKEEEENLPIQPKEATVVLAPNAVLNPEVMALPSHNESEAGSTPSKEAQPDALPQEESKITMLDAPIKYLLIKSTEEYKKFKNTARGSYPKVDFNKQMLVVLESDSNLPDKVFEIQNVQEQDGKLLVTYRVNIFCLEKKLNTHSVQAVKKSALPVELKQVL